MLHIAHFAAPRNKGLLNVVTFAEVAAIAAESWLPSAVFASWSEDGTDITVPIASFEGLTASAADALTGDARQVISSILVSIFAWYNALAAKPEALSISMSRRIQNTGDFTGTELTTYTCKLYTDYPSGLIASEPE
jgi:hypothetical protein